MFVVDTNILVYAANRDAPERSVCRTLLETWRRQKLPWFSTWGILYEFLRVTTHPRLFARPISATVAWQFVEALLAAPGLRILAPTDRHPEIVRRILDEVPELSGNVMNDLRTAAVMREHGIRTIYTHDRDFRRFPFLEVLDPVGPGGPPRGVGEPRPRRSRSRHPRSDRR